MEHIVGECAGLVSVFDKYPSVFWEVNLHVPAGQQINAGVDQQPRLFIAKSGNVVAVPSPSLISGCFWNARYKNEWQTRLSFLPPQIAFRQIMHQSSFESEVRQAYAYRRSGGVYVYDVVNQRKVPAETLLDPDGYAPFEEIPGLVVGYVHIFVPPACLRALSHFFNQA